MTLARREPSPMRYGMGIGPFDDEGRLILLEYNVLFLGIEKLTNNYLK